MAGNKVAAFRLLDAYIREYLYPEMSGLGVDVGDSTIHYFHCLPLKCWSFANK
jgi:hypothetical protein